LWVGCLGIGFDATGRYRRRAVYAHSKQAVQLKLRKLQSDAESGMLTTNPERRKLKDYLPQWLETHRTKVRKNTHAIYQLVIKNHIAKHIGAVQLTKLNPEMVEGLYAAMEKAGASPRMRLLAHAVLHRALKQAVLWNLVPRNVCDAVVPPRVTKKEMKVLNADQVALLLKAAAGHRLEALITLAISTGLRQAELFGLQWSDFDLRADSGTVSVQRQLEEVCAQLTLTEPKSAKGRRVVELPAIAVQAMWKHKALMLQEGHLDATTFCDSQGKFLRKSNFVRKVFKPLLKKAGLPDIRFHDLRHTSATLLLSQGVHPKVVQERLGHSQISLTLDTYSHVLPSMQKDAAERLNGILAKAQNG
jgi:integrase